LQVGEQPVAQVPHHPVAELGGQVCLPDADQSRHQGDRDTHAHQGAEQAEPGGAGRPVRQSGEQGAVEDRLGEERDDDAERRGPDDGHRDEQDASAVRLEQRDDPAPGPVRGRWFGGAGRPGLGDVRGDAHFVTLHCRRAQWQPEGTRSLGWQPKPRGLEVGLLWVEIGQPPVLRIGVRSLRAGGGASPSSRYDVIDSEP